MNTFKSLLFPCDIFLLSFVPSSLNQMDALSFLFGLLMYSSPLWGFYRLRYQLKNKNKTFMASVTAHNDCKLS